MAKELKGNMLKVVKLEDGKLKCSKLKIAKLKIAKLKDQLTNTGKAGIESYIKVKKIVDGMILARAPCAWSARS